MHPREMDKVIEMRDDADRRGPRRDLTPDKSASQTAGGVVARPVRFSLLTAAELLAFPPAEWLIEGMLEVGAQAILFGPSGQGKTFVALDWALSVATGRPWHDRKVKHGPVVYVVAEGGRGMRRRVAAWMQANTLTTVDKAFFLLEAVQLRNMDDYGLLLDRLKEQHLAPSLIVLDTFARCFVGGDENQSKDVGEFVDAARRLHEVTGASVLAVHHTGKTGDQERGSSALRAAADAMFKVSQAQHGGVVLIENDKQKDDEQCPTIRVRLKRVGIGDGSETSCVLIAAEADGATSRLTAAEQRALTVLRGFPEGTTSSTEWRQALTGEGGRKVKAKTFDNWRRTLIESGHVEAVLGVRHRYRAVKDETETDHDEETANAIDVPLVH
jgi:hypothetical protein